MTKTVAYIEIDVPVCSLTCGTAPCGATPTTGAECFNSRKTCIDLDELGAPVHYAEAVGDNVVRYDFASGSEGWSATGATITHNPSGTITLTSTSGDPIMVSAVIGAIGSSIYVVEMRIRRIAGSSQQGTVYYATPAHGYEESHSNYNMIGGISGEWSALRWDMRDLTHGGDDWIISTINHVRIDIGTSADDVFEIDYISLGSPKSTIRFGHPDANDQSGIDHIPSLKSIAYRPQKISLAEDLGVRASVSVTLIDHRDSDTGAAGDPYWTTRGYNPFEQGTFWGKFRARFPYMTGAILRYYQGTEGQTLAGMDVRTFVIDKISGPSLDGKVTITAKDVLKLADDDKAQCPVISTGRLSADITTTATSITLSPSGIGNTEYPASGYVTIGGKEVCSFTRSGDTMTLTRAQFYTESAEHKTNDIVQLCKAFFTSGGAGLDPADILYDLFTNYTGIKSSWIPISDWRVKTAAYVDRLYYTLIAEPTSVKTLASELIEQTGIILYSDDISSDGTPYIRLDVVRQQADTLRAFDETSIMAGSFSVADQPDKRLSQVWTYYGQRSPIEKLSDTQNYAAAVAIIDEDAEISYGVPAIKKIYSRWIPRTNRPAASDLGFRLLSRFRDAPRVIEFASWRHSSDPTTVLALAGRYNVTAWPLQLPTGEQTTANVQVTELDPGDAEMTATAQELLWYNYPEEPEQPKTVIFEQDQLNVNLRTEYDKNYPVPASGETVTFIIEIDVVIGSESTASYSIVDGDWPDGVTVMVKNNGYIVGAGGGSINRPDPGGDAIYTRTAMIVENYGIIGGGGGGGGGLMFVDLYPYGPFSAGGGGAGANPGLSSINNGTLLAGGKGDGWFGAAGDGVTGDGGDLGQPGANATGSYPVMPIDGGAAGNAVDGNSYITWTTLGDVRGARVN